MKTIHYSGFEFILIYRSDFATVFYNADLALALCSAEAEYIPIDNFREIFLAVSGLIEKYPMRHFLFDKRSLRTFHQPSMEWYFSTWKPMISKQGLNSHYKILPDLEWFVQAVNAGKHEIFKAHGIDFMEGINVTYMDSVEDVILHCQKEL